VNSKSLFYLAHFCLLARVHARWMEHYEGPLPPEALRDFSRAPAPRPVIRDAPVSRRITQVGYGTVVFLLVLIALTVAGLVVYITVTESRLQKMEDQLDDLKDAATTVSQSQRLRMDALLERQQPDPSALPHASQPSKPVVAAKPKWARNLAPQWLQFETPVEGGAFRLPPTGGHRGLYQAHQNGYTVECVFGADNTQPARTAISMEFHLNDEDGQEYADAEVIAPAFRGRECAIEWMSE
jgi:hypothetical protein